jgi:hypothetical protein
LAFVNVTFVKFLENLICGQCKCEDLSILASGVAPFVGLEYLIGGKLTFFSFYFFHINVLVNGVNWSCLLWICTGNSNLLLKFLTFLEDYISWVCCCFLVQFDVLSTFFV